MAQNPELTRQGPVATPTINRNTQPLEAALNTAAQVGVQVAHDNIIDSFREDLYRTVDEARQVAPDFAAQEADIASAYPGVDQLSKFKRTMATLQAAAAQGVMSSTQQLLEVEKLVRREQTRRPGLAAEFQREASLVLGTNPIGTALSVAQKAETSAQKLAQDNYKDLVDYGYDTLRINRAIHPTDPRWMELFVEKEALEQAKLANERLLEVTETNNALMAPQRIMAMNDMLRPGRVFDSFAAPLYAVIEGLNSLSPQDRLAWYNGNTNINGQTIDSVKATISGMKGNLMTSVLELTEGDPELIAKAQGMSELPLKMFDDMLGVLDDPDRDINAMKRELDFWASLYVNQLEPGAQRAVAVTEFARPLIELANSSQLPTNQVYADKMINWMLASARGLTSVGQGTVPLTASQLDMELSGSFPQLIDDVASDFYGQTRPKRRALEAILDTTTEALDTYDFSELGTEHVDAMLLAPYSSIQYLNTLNTPEKELLDSTVDMITSDRFLETALLGSNERRGQVAGALQTFFVNQYAPYTEELAAEILSDTVAVERPITQDANQAGIGRRGAISNLNTAPAVSSVEFLEIDTSGVREKGEIRFNIVGPPSGATLSPAGRSRLQQKANEWAVRINKAIKAQAVLGSLNRNNGVPDYVAVYNSYALGGVNQRESWVDIPFSRLLIPIPQEER